MRRHLAKNPVDLVMLDLNLPGEDGLSLARDLRATSDVAIIMITGKGDPIDRIVSHWMHLRSRENQEQHGLNDAVRERAEYIDHSLYDHQLGFYRDRFPADRLLVLFFDDFKRAPDAVLDRCFRFLDVDPDVQLEDADTPRHVSGRGRVDRPLLTPLRRLPGFGAVRDALPAGVRDSLRRLFKRSIGTRPTWDDATRAWLIEQLAADSRMFLERYRPDGTWWSWVPRDAGEV